jgi:hypothetical protein
MGRGRGGSLGVWAHQIHDLVTAGCAITLTAHAREEMAADAVSLVDVVQVLRSGTVRQAPDRDVRTGDWKVRVEGRCDDREIVVVVVPETARPELRVVTVWEGKRR